MWGFLQVACYLQTEKKKERYVSSQSNVAKT